MANNLDRLISAIEKQNEQLGNLIQTNEKLHSTPFDMTSIEKIKILSEEVAELGKKFDDSLSEANKHFSGLFTDKSKIIHDLSEATKRLRDNLQKVQDEQNKLDNTLQLISEHEEKFGKNTKKMTASQAEYYKNLKNARDRYRKQLKDEKEAYEENKDVLTDLRNASSEYYRKANEEQEKLNKRIVEGTHFMDDSAEKWEQRTRALRKGAKEVSSGTKQIYTSLKSMIEPWSKANHEAMNYARNMGMSQKTADKFLSNTVSWAAKNDIGILFNKTTDELIKMQGKYSEVLGRNVQLTDEQKKDMLAIEKVIGEDGMTDIANNLENFGLGMSDTANFIHKTMNEATKSGIAASKLTKVIRENIKMAQNYTFKNGLDGLSNMAKKAIELKTDMSLVNGFIEKTSTVEGAITTGANLQVLGGSYAAASDPLSMMYESLNNVEGLFDRATHMAKGKVFYNNQTGNFEMGAMDRYMMKQAATQMGIDPSKLIDVAFRQASLDKIENEAKMSNIGNDKEMVDLVKNLATWNNGHAVVNIDGVDKKVSELKATDKDELKAMQRTDSQNLQDIAIKLRSINDIISGVEKETSNEQAKASEKMAVGINGLLRQNGEILDTVAKIGAWKNLITGGFGILGGVWATASGVIRMGKGIGNLTRGGATIGHNKGVLNRTKQTGRVFQKHGMKGVGRLAKTTFKSGMKTIGGVGGVALGGLAGGALSLGADMMTGEFNRDLEGSLGRAAGATAGTALGMLLSPFLGPLGPMLGGWAGNAIVGAVQDAQKETRGEVRKAIASRLIDTAPTIAGLFSGPNALEGNYNERQLKKLEKALADGSIDESDDLNYWIKRKLRNNNDLIKMKEQGIKVNIPMAKGGYLNTDSLKNGISNGGFLNGLRHHEGGMPILGSNISVEGGEFVMNRESTKVLRPYLERMNNGDYSMISKEPLGKQMSVYKKPSYGADMPYNSKLNIEPISINISGTIKLDSGNKQIDITNELLNNSQLLNRLTDIITKQINILDNNAYNKGAFKQKFT